MADPNRPVRRRMRTFPTRGIPHLVVLSLVVGSALLGVLSAQGILVFDGSAIRVVAPARAGISEEVAAAEDAEVTFELQPPTEGEALDGLHAVPTPGPDPVAAIPLPKPPPVRSGATTGASYPWAGPTGYIDGDGSLIWPVPGGYVSQYFWGGHQALDIAHSYGRAVVAAATGTVISAGWMNNGGGIVITIQHSDGRVTGYNHLGSTMVSAGQAVMGGQQIGTVGCTGMCTGPHVHFQVIVNGVLVNPLRYL